VRVGAGANAGVAQLGDLRALGDGLADAHEVAAVVGDVDQRALVRAARRFEPQRDAAQAAVGFVVDRLGDPGGERGDDGRALVVGEVDAHVLTGAAVPGVAVVGGDLGAGHRTDQSAHRAGRR
jgi:hypothetical protein